MLKYKQYICRSVSNWSSYTIFSANMTGNDVFMCFERFCAPMSDMSFMSVMSFMSAQSIMSVISVMSVMNALSVMSFMSVNSGLSILSVESAVSKEYVLVTERTVPSRLPNI